MSGLVVQVAGASTALHLVHGQVGLAQQGCGVALFMSAHGDTDAGADMDRVTVDDDRLAQRRQKPFGYLVGFGDRLEILQQDGELVASEPRYRVGLP